MMFLLDFKMSNNDISCYCMFYQSKDDADHVWKAIWLAARK